MLVEIGRRIAVALGEDGVVARIRGDEFAILAERVDDAAHSMALASRVLVVVGKTLWLGGRELFPQYRIGISHTQPRYRLGHDIVRDDVRARYRRQAERPARTPRAT